MAAAEEITDHARRIRANALLAEIYREIYTRLVAQVPVARYPRLLELGAGGGFFRSFAPHAITSDCVTAPGIDRVVDACRLPEHFGDGTLDALVGVNVFHHLPDVAGFLAGASRVLRPGGRIALVEPWFTPLGQYFHRWIHHEPHRADPSDWRLVGDGRLAGANTRLPTSVFRDSRARFAREFPELVVIEHEPFHKWLYLLSGGLRLNTRVPAALARRLVALDAQVRTGNASWGLFALIVVDRRAAP